MAYGLWLFVAVSVYMCSSGVGAVCWDTFLCKEPGSKDKQLAKSPESSPTALDSNEENLSLGVLLVSLAAGGKIQLSKLDNRNEERRSYAMEHFRWGKPAGRKRRPVKVSVSSSGGGFTPQVRRQLGYRENVENGDLVVQQPKSLELKAVKYSPKMGFLLSPQESKNETYRMSHFRWSTPTQKRHSIFAKTWDEKSQKSLLRFFQSISSGDAQ
ncbi:pro-opiomelanocortin-like [Lampris incognitus]|uniref:pro-opiomelanocortin-like n=1 Tax=Lampris incognitus TaxID=2546036 RepID=UPI0024B63035|nr:pro-opiomelanocortin-like [Lampris incognitus]